MLLPSLVCDSVWLEHLLVDLDAPQRSICWFYSNHAWTTRPVQTSLHSCIPTGRFTMQSHLEASCQGHSFTVGKITVLLLKSSLH